MPTSLPLGRFQPQPGVCRAPTGDKEGCLPQITVPCPALPCPSILDSPAKSSPGDVKGCDIWEQTQPVSPKPLPAPHTPRHNTSCLMCSTCIPKSLTSHRKQGWKGAQQSPNPSLKQSWHNYKVSLETPRSITGCTWEVLHSSLMLQGTWQLCENTQHPQAKQELKEKHCLF